VLGGVRDVALIQYPSGTDSIKLSLQFLCIFVVINASEGSLCFQIFISKESRQFAMIALVCIKTLPNFDFACVFP
jgi:hypothetical protein